MQDFLERLNKSTKCLYEYDIKVGAINGPPAPVTNRYIKPIFCDDFVRCSTTRLSRDQGIRRKTV
jgi:hypothetical protein